MSLKRIYDVTLTTLTPLHIGTGRELQRGFDYVSEASQNRTWVLNADAFLESLQTENGEFDDQLLGVPAGDLLKPEDFSPDNPFFRYNMPGIPASRAEAAPLREQIKDVYDRPYMPGSSLKGALRTVVAWHGYMATGQKLAVDRLETRRGWTGQRVEQAYLGRNPNYDLLRALHVADSAPHAGEALAVLNINVVTGSAQPGAPIPAEVVAGQTAFRTTITLDDYLFGEQAEPKLRLGEKKPWLDTLPSLARQWSYEQLRKEYEWARGHRYTTLAQFYADLLRQLRDKKLRRGQFFLQIGWGGGWQSKTIGYPLQQDANEWAKLLAHRTLSPSRMGRVASGEAFPKSRRAIIGPGQPQSKRNYDPLVPLGWCLVEMKERK